MADPSQDIKNESRVIQQKITDLTYKVTAMGGHSDILAKLTDMDERVRRIETAMNDKLRNLESRVNFACDQIDKLRTTMSMQRPPVEEEKKLGF